MLDHLLPILTVVIVVVIFAIITDLKRRKGIVFVAWDRRISIAAGVPLLGLHVAFTLYFMINNGVYLYILHTDLCTMLYPWVTIMLFIDNRKWLEILCPVAFIGGFLELASSKIVFKAGDTFNDVASYLKHLLLIFISLYIYINITKYSYRDFGKTILWFATFCLYIVLVVGVPHWATGNDKIGNFSIAIVEPAYREVNVSWNSTPYLLAEFGVLSGWGYPFGTIALFIVATSLGFAMAVACEISSKWKVNKKIDWLKKWPVQNQKAKA